MTLRRRTPLRRSPGTIIPDAVRAAARRRDVGCIGPLVGMLDPCMGGLELDHVRAGGMGLKSASVEGNLVTLCAAHHRLKTEHARHWRPVLLAYLAGQSR